MPLLRACIARRLALATQSTRNDDAGGKRDAECYQRAQPRLPGSLVAKTLGSVGDAPTDVAQRLFRFSGGVAGRFNVVARA